MAEINAAYDVLRSEAWQAEKRAGTRADPAPGRSRRRAPPRARVRPRAGGSPEPLRRALGPELLSALHPGEDVALVTPASAWASPQALLAVTDRRLLWLLDDAVTGRVRSLDLGAIAGVVDAPGVAAAAPRRPARRAAQRAPAAVLQPSCGPRPRRRSPRTSAPPARRVRTMNPFRHRLRVRYGECDPQGVVYFARYSDYVDIGMTELWRERIGPYGEMVEAGSDMVVAELQLRYRASALFDDEIDVVIESTGWGRRR